MSDRENAAFFLAASASGCAPGKATSPLKNRVGFFCRRPSGRTGGARRPRRGTASGCRARGYKPASGRAIDGNGNVIAYVDLATGAKSATYEYNAFGETIISDGPAAELFPFKFSTRYTDQETGIVMYPRRPYLPWLGRFGTNDPIEEQGGVNLYAFVANNPINWVDPFGLAYFAYRSLDSFSGKLIGVWGSKPGSEDDTKNTVTAHEQIFFEDGKPPGNLGYFDDNTVRPDKSKLKYELAHSSGWNDCVMRKAVAAVKPKPFCLLEKKGKEKYNCQDFSGAVRSEYQKLIKDLKVLAECCPTEAEKNK